MSWQAILYVLAVILIFAVPAFIFSLLLYRFSGVSQNGGYAICIAFVLLLLGVAAIFEHSFSDPTSVMLIVMVSMVTIHIGSRIGSRLRMLKKVEASRTK
jgi:uncharacterized membrane protein YjfL (UPF0719 family)